jgi:anti-sigma B factor antagonist
MTELAGQSDIHYVPLVPDDGGQVPAVAAKVLHESDGAVVQVTGDLDLASAPAFHRQVLSLFALPLGSITLDLRGLDFLDSSGLRALVAIREVAGEHRVTLALRSVPENARRVLELTDLADEFDIEA